MAINKVIFKDKVLMDTSMVTVKEDNMLEGTTALGADGELITGKLVTAPLYNNLDQELEGYALDARQGAKITEKINSIDFGFYIDSEGFLCQKIRGDT